MPILIAVIVTFFLTIICVGIVLWFAARRVTRHLQGNAEGTHAVVEHVVAPLLGGKKAEEKQP